jgi:GAF domain-containing protein
VELERIQTDHNTQARLWSLTVLDQLSAAVGQSLVLEDLLEAGLAALIEAFDFEAGAVVMRHPAHQLQLACRVGLFPVAVESWLTDEAGGGWLMSAPESVVRPDEANQHLWPPGLIQPGQSMCGLPLHIEDESLGVAVLTSGQMRNLSPVELATLEQASGRLALAVRNALRYRLADDETEDNGTAQPSDRDQLGVSLLYQVGKELSGQLDTEQLLDQILALAPRLGAQFAYIIETVSCTSGRPHRVVRNSWGRLGVDWRDICWRTALRVGF